MHPTLRALLTCLLLLTGLAAIPAAAQTPPAAQSHADPAQTHNAPITGTIRGKDGTAVEAATVLLLRQKDSSVAKTAVTDKAGSFRFDHIPQGQYFMAVTPIGFQSYRSHTIIIDYTTNAAVLPDITLAVAPKNLAAASVVSQRRFIEWKTDKMVVNVASSPFFNAGQSGLDVLERSPGIDIDYMNNIISLNGRNGTVVYVNGRLTHFSGQDLINYLRSLPAGTLDQIEIMSQPPAKYDAAGSGGVINIILKKNQADGLFGSFTVSTLYGYYFKTRDNLVIDWRKGKLDLNLSYGFSGNKGFNDQHILSSFRPDYSAPFSQYQDYQTSTISNNLTHTPRLSLDYQASRNTSLGLNLTGMFGHNNSMTNGPIDLYDSLHHVAQQAAFTSTTKSPVSNAGVNLNLLQKLGKGKELTADADYLYYHSPGIQDSYNYTYDSQGNPLAPYLLNGNTPSQIDIYAFKSDYSQPLHFGDSSDTKLEAGIKSSYVRTDNNSQYTIYDTLQKNWQPDAGLTNHFIYSEYIDAAYVNFSRELNKKWSVELGVRAEQTSTRGNETVRNNRFTRNYFQLFPTGYIGYKPNDIHSFDLSYGRRMDRPSYLDLNPFQYIINQYNIREGNPSLQPEFVNNFEFSYHYKSEFTIWLDYIKFDNEFARVFTSSGQGNDIVTIQTKENVQSRRNIFLFFFYNKTLTKWWNMNWQVSVQHARIEDPTNIDHPIDQISTFRFNLNNNFPVGKGWSLDLRGNYATRRLEGIRIYALSSGYFSLGVNKKLLKDKGTLTAYCNDPFALFKPGQTSEGPGFFTTTTNHPESRYLTLTFNYRFGKTKQRRNSDGSAEDEQRRVNL
jgi:outer membrane receptor protein involved in Fe transport